MLLHQACSRGCRVAVLALHPRCELPDSLVEHTRRYHQHDKKELYYSFHMIGEVGEGVVAGAFAFINKLSRPLFFALQAEER